MDASNNTEEQQPAATAAVVLLSGGLDSTTVLAMATAAGYRCYCLSFQYGQRHTRELDLARANAARWEAAGHLVLRLEMEAIGGSALTGEELAVPKDRLGLTGPAGLPGSPGSPGSPGPAESPGEGTRASGSENGAEELAIEGGTESDGEDIPVTYVPGRNTIFLAYAASWAEVLGAGDIFIGVNAVDFSGYPDCRPDYLEAMAAALNLGSRAGRQGRPFRLQAPLLHLSKEGIIRRGLELGVDYGQTHSCYDPDSQHRSCGRCDACLLRLRGFAAAGRSDPLVYRERG